MARIESNNNADITEIRTMIGLFSTEKRALANWVLSPHSASNISVKPDRNGFFSSGFSWVLSSFWRIDNKPSMINSDPAIIFSQNKGIRLTIQEPTRMAKPSTTRKASITPSKS